MRKPFNYDAIQVGEVLGCKQVLITDDLVQTCAHAIESTHPWYFAGSPYIVMELVAADQDGVEICRGQHTSLWQWSAYRTRSGERPCTPSWCRVTGCT